MASFLLLKEELPTYLATAEGAGCDTDRLLWWKMNESTLPAWASSSKSSPEELSVPGLAVLRISSGKQSYHIPQLHRSQADTI